MEQYKSNSHKSKADEAAKEKDIKKVVSKDTERKKKSGLQKFANDFISEDIDNVKSYVWTEIILPNIKDIAFNSLRTAFEMFIYGDGNRSRGNSSRNSQSRISYERCYHDSGNRREQSSRNRGRVGYNFDDIIFSTYAEAEETLTSMDDIIDQYGIISVADYYSLAGQSTNHMDRKYGWDDIVQAKIVRTRNGKYFIKLPRAELID